MSREAMSGIDANTKDKFRDPISDIRVRCCVERLDEVNLKDQSFTATFKLEMSWMDDTIFPKIWEKLEKANHWSQQDWKELIIVGVAGQDRKLQVTCSHEGHESYDIGSFNIPRVIFHNQIEEKAKQEWFELYLIFDAKAEHGVDSVVVVMKWDCKCVFQERYELERFPWDTQELTIDVRLQQEVPRRWKINGGESMGKKLEDKFRSYLSTHISSDPSAHNSIRGLVEVNGDWVIVRTPNKRVLDLMLEVVQQQQKETKTGVICKPMVDGQDIAAEKPTTAADPKAQKAEKPTRLVQNLNGKYASVVSTDTFVQSSEYDLVDAARFEADLSHPMESLSRKVYSILRIKMLLGRRNNAWFYNCILPMVLLTCCSFAAFFVEAEELADRSGITLTILLTIVAFKIVVNDKLPLTNYLTFIEKHILMSMIVVCCIVFENIIAKIILNVQELLQDPEEDINYVKDHEWWIASIIFVGLYSMWVGSFAWQALSYENDQKTRAIEHVNRTVLWCQWKEGLKILLEQGSERGEQSVHEKLKEHVEAKLKDYARKDYLRHELESGRNTKRSLHKDMMLLLWGKKNKKIDDEIHSLMKEFSSILFKEDEAKSLYQFYKEHLMKKLQPSEITSSPHKEAAAQPKYRPYPFDKSFFLIEFPKTEQGMRFAKFLVHTDHMFTVEADPSVNNEESNESQQSSFEFLSDTWMYLPEAHSYKTKNQLTHSVPAENKVHPHT